MALALCAALVCLVPASLIGKDAFPQPATAYNLAKMQKERMGRGVYAVRISESEVLVGWRYKSNDHADVAFDVYAGKQKLNTTPIRDVTYFKAPWTGNRTRYTVVKAARPLVREQSMSWILPANAPVGYFDIALVPPPDSVLPDGSKVGHHPCDCTVGDLDGDGRPETVAVVHCDAGSGTPPSGIYVLTQGSGAAPRVVATLVDPADRKTVSDVAVRDGVVSATLLGYSSLEVPRCCPDQEEQVSWRWQGNAFVRSAGDLARSA